MIQICKTRLLFHLFTKKYSPFNDQLINLMVLQFFKSLQFSFCHTQRVMQKMVAMAIQFGHFDSKWWCQITQNINSRLPAIPGSFHEQFDRKPWARPIVKDYQKTQGPLFRKETVLSTPGSLGGPPEIPRGRIGPCERSIQIAVRIPWPSPMDFHQCPRPETYPSWARRSGMGGIT